MNSDSKDVLSLLGYLFLRHGKADKAITALEALSVAEPNKPWVQRSLAYAYLKHGDFENSLTQVSKYLDHHREDRGAQLIRSRALWGLGRHDEARKLVQQMSGQLRATDGG